MISRRTALVALATFWGYLNGKSVQGAQGQEVNLVLDSVAVILVRYRGQTVAVTPADIMAALAPPPIYQQQMPFPGQMAPPPVYKK